ncbi:MAG: flagellar hook-length control protein FliK [Desulfovibrio sp.]|nr:flagellar hook-length control protein FliK [Desulfovibrio sp.]
MQFFPVSDAFDGAGVFAPMNSGKGEKFMSAMEDALGAVRDGDNVSASSALNDASAGPLVESPYTRHTTDGVTYTLSEVCFSKNELLELRRQLIKEGAPEASLKQFDVLADQPDGATLAQVMASLMGGQNQYSLTEQDEHTITALLGQIDPSGSLATSVLDFMREGRSGDAMDLLQDALGKMGSADTLDVDADALVALGRGMGLNQSTIQSLVDNLGGASSLSLNGAQFDQLLNPAKSQIMDDAAQAQKLADALDKTLKPMISKARARMEKEQAAAQLEDRRIAQSRILIDKTVQENSRKTIDDTVTGETVKSGEAEKPGEILARINKDSMNKTANAEIRQDGDADPRVAVRENLKETVARQFAEDGDESGAGELFDKKGDNGWGALLGKIETKAQAPIQQINFAATSMFEGQAGAENLANIEQRIPNLPAHLAGQVEQGLLTAMRDGSTRLDLQLHPAELGNITISLVARNGELTAQIRSERTETAEMIQRQLETVRVSLEEQGIKVDKLEVQLQDNRENFQDAFLNLGDHNARREHDARRQEMARIRNLAALRGNGENISDAGLAQSMHDLGRTARYAGAALHVIA